VGEAQVQVPGSAHDSPRCLELQGQQQLGLPSEVQLLVPSVHVRCLEQKQLSLKSHPAAALTAGVFQREDQDLFQGASKHDCWFLEVQ
jgi:hypothetical protein